MRGRLPVCRSSVQFPFSRVRITDQAGERRSSGTVAVRFCGGNSTGGDPWQRRRWSRCGVSAGTLRSITSKAIPMTFKGEAPCLSGWQRSWSSHPLRRPAAVDDGGACCLPNARRPRQAAHPSAQTSRHGRQGARRAVQREPRPAQCGTGAAALETAAGLLALRARRRFRGREGICLHPAPVPARTPSPSQAARCARSSRSVH
jgi:hypothetical protein